MDNFIIIIKSPPGQGSGAAEGLRLAASMLGMDVLPVVVFMDGGVDCLLPGAFEDPALGDYLRTAADLAGVYVLSESLAERGVAATDLDQGLAAEAIGLDELAEMVLGCRTTAAF